MDIFDVNSRRRIQSEINTIDRNISVSTRQRNHKIILRDDRIKRITNLFEVATRGLSHSSKTFIKLKTKFDGQISTVNNFYKSLLDNYNSRIIFLQNKKNKMLERMVYVPQESRPDYNYGTFSELSLTIQTTNTFNDLMNYYITTLGTPPNGNSDPNNFMIPYVPKNYNLKIDVSEDGIPNYSNCKYGGFLGVDNFGFITSIEIKGYFTAKTTDTEYARIMNLNVKPNSILTSGVYIAKELVIYSPQPDGFELVARTYTLNYDPNNFNENVIFEATSSPNYTLDPYTVNGIVTAINSLTNWARDTAFLTRHLCRNLWTTPYGDPVLLSSITSNTSVCTADYNPVCDLLTNRTYSNSCVANNDGVYRVETGICKSLISGQDFGNLSVPQTPTKPWNPANGNTLLFAPELPNVLQAEYYSRLYAFMRKNINATPNIMNLSNWARSYLLNYELNIPTFFYF